MTTATLVIAVLLGAVATLVPRDTLLDGWLVDLGAAVRASVDARPLDGAKVLVAGLDQRSLDHPRLAGTPRALFSPVHAELVDKVISAGADAVAIDLILAYDASGLEMEGTHPLRRYDSAFLRLLRAPHVRGRVFLGRSAQILPARRFRRVAGDEALGMVEVPLGTGGVVRSVPMVYQDSAGVARPSLTGRVLALLGHSREEPVAVIPGGPLDQVPGVSVIDLLECASAERLRALVDGRVVYLGSVLPGEDRFRGADRLMARGVSAAQQGEACEFPPLPVRSEGDATVPGIYLHAAAADAVISGWAPRRAPDAVHAALVAVLALAGGMAARLRRPLAGMTVTLGAALGGFGVLTAGLAGGWLIPGALPVLAAPGAFALASGVRIALIDRKDRQIRQAFGRFLSPVIVDRMILTGTAPALGGEEREVTILFADLSGFTATSETMESAELTQLLNRYLNRITTIVRSHGGYVDKFIGDAVMAMWNAPVPVEDHAGAAVRAAMEIREAVAEEGAGDAARGLPGFSVKIGVNTGSATVGNIGSRDRMDFTVIGETVNLAARLEGLPSLFRTPVIVGPETAARASDRWFLLELAAIQVKGKRAGVRVSAPLVPRDQAGSVLHERAGAYAAALTAFERNALDDAEAAWQGLATAEWPGAGPAAAMLDEIAWLRRYPVPGFSGVIEARSK